MENNSGYQTYDEAYCQMIQLWTDDKLQESIDHARAMLQDTTLPRYYRIKTLILLGRTLGTWEEAESCRVRAEKIWRKVRRMHPTGQLREVDQAIDELRADLDMLDAMLQAESAEIDRAVQSSPNDECGQVSIEGASDQMSGDRTDDTYLADLQLKAELAAAAMV